MRAEQIAAVSIGATPSRSVPRYWAESEGGFPWVAISDLKSKYLSDTAERITETGIEESSVKLVPAGTPLMSFKLSIGRAAIPTRDVYTNEAIAAFTPHDGVDAEFLYYALPLAAASCSADVAIKGSTLNRGKLLAMELLLPPLTEQREIAATLKVADEAVAAGESVVRHVENVRRELATTLFHVSPSGKRTGPLPQDWRESSVGAECNTASGGTPSRSEPTYWNGPIPWVKTGEVNYSTIYSTEESLTDAGVTHSAAHLVPARAVIIAMYGQKATRGRCALLGIDAALNQACLALIPSRMDRGYLFHYLWHIYPAIRELGHEGTQKNLNSSLVRGIPIPVPPAREQRQVAETMSAVMRRVETEQAVVSQGLRVRSALADALLKGHLRVRDVA